MVNDYFLQNVFEFNFALSFLFVISILFVFFWKNIFNFFKLKEYDSVQKTHEIETPRIGGILILLTIIFYVITDFNHQNNSLKIFFYNLLPSLFCFGFFSAKEDIFHNVKPTQRLFSLVVATLLFFYINDFELPFVDIPLIGNLINNPFILIPVFTLGVVAVSNGTNMIDGVNGLAIVVSITILFSLSFLAITFDDYFILNISIFLISLMIILLSINYPFGFLFLGDFGAYFVGFICSLLTIIFFGRNPGISNYVAILILCYPLTEVIFSFFRKFFSNNVHPFYPDRKHIHLLIFDIINLRGISTKCANNLIMPLLCSLWLLPVLILPYVFHSKVFTIFAIFLYIFVYLLHYFILRRLISLS